MSFSVDYGSFPKDLPRELRRFVDSMTVRHKMEARGHNGVKLVIEDGQHFVVGIGDNVFEFEILRRSGNIGQDHPYELKEVRVVSSSNLHAVPYGVFRSGRVSRAAR
jgi:hypothetical protein